MNAFKRPHRGALPAIAIAKAGRSFFKVKCKTAKFKIQKDVLSAPTARIVSLAAKVGQDCRKIPNSS
ncbi:MAG: hypothetical protein DRI69_08625 [Bacteroidetes bacterium]|nr:MAG: hypothetical protein DRI69_08625 [Bacteroidota bacterium]